MQARDLMRRKVITATPEMTLKELADLFINRHITGAPVVDRIGKTVGVVSQTDLVRHEHEAGAPEVATYHIEPDELQIKRGFQIEAPDYTRVKDVMTPKVISFDEATDISEVASVMLRRRIHRVVITSKGKLTGILTSMDLLKAIAGGHSVASAGARGS